MWIYSRFSRFFEQKRVQRISVRQTIIKMRCIWRQKFIDIKINKTPIIFVHGNSDVAFGRGTIDGYAEWQTGFSSLATYFMSQGYDKSELYTTTWGQANPSKASDNYHSKQIILSTRAFVEAVLAYTKVNSIVIISHSMRVSISRRVIKGGHAFDHTEGNYSVGTNLTNNIKAFIGLAGANYGLNACYAASTIPTCSIKDGFYPGLFPNAGPSKFLNDINFETGLQEPDTYTIWSKFDDLIGNECLVWGQSTCRIPYQEGQVVKATADWTHFKVRDGTGPDIIKWL